MVNSDDYYIDVSGWYLIAGEKDVSLNTTIEKYINTNYTFDIIEAYVVENNNKENAQPSKRPGMFTVDDWEPITGNNTLNHNIGVWCNIELTYNESSMITLTQNINQIIFKIPSYEDFSKQFRESVEYLQYKENNYGIFGIFNVVFETECSLNKIIFSNETHDMSFILTKMPDQEQDDISYSYYNSGAQFQDYIPPGEVTLKLADELNKIPQIKSFQIVLKDVKHKSIETYSSDSSLKKYKDGSFFMKVKNNNN